jgi:uncharacterized SAM-binding protein YcdF (DUF218 family)
VSHVILSPLGLGLLCLGLRWGLLRSGAGRWGTIWTWPVLGLCLVMMTPLGANLLVLQLEGHSRPLARCTSDGSRPLILLTGGLDRPAQNEQDFAALTEVSLRRVMDLWASGQVKVTQSVLVSGGGQVNGPTESELARALLIQLGARPEQVQSETHSTSTWENAREVSRLMPASTRQIVLVTSAMHMPRATMAFVAQGFDVCELPVEPQYLPPGGLGYYLPQSSSLQKSERALHEVLGLLVYRMRQH